MFIFHRCPGRLRSATASLTCLFFALGMVVGADVVSAGEAPPVPTEAKAAPLGKSKEVKEKGGAKEEKEIAALRKKLEAALRRKDPEGQALGRIQLAAALWRVGKKEESGALFNDALTQLPQLTGEPFLTAVRGLKSHDELTGAPEKTAAHLTRVVEAMRRPWRESGGPERVAAAAAAGGLKESTPSQRKLDRQLSLALMTLGDLLVERSRGQEAYAVWEESLALHRLARGEAKDQAMLLNRLASLDGGAERETLREERAREALDLARKLKNEALILDSWSGLVSLLGARKNPADLQSLTEQLLEPWGAEISSAQKAELLFIVAKTHAAGREFEAALEVSQQVFERFRQAKLPQKSAEALLFMGKVSLQQGDDAKALEFVEKAFEIEKKSPKPWNLRRKALETWADALIHLGRAEEVLPFLREEMNRLNRLGSEEKSLDRIQAQSVQVRLVSALIALNHHVEALSEMERPRQSDMKKLILSRFAEASDPEPAGEAWGKTLEPDQAVILFNNKGRDRVMAAREKVVSTRWSERQEAEISRRIMSAADAFYQKTRDDGPPIRGGVRGGLKKGGKSAFDPLSPEAYVKHAEPLRHSATAAQLESLAVSFIRLASLPQRGVSVAQQELMHQLGRLYYDYFFAPLKKELSARKELVLIPSDYLLDFPWGMLVDEKGEYLANRFRLSRAPSLGVVHALHQIARPGPRSRMLILGPGLEEAPPEMAGGMNLSPEEGESGGGPGKRERFRTESMKETEALAALVKEREVVSGTALTVDRLRTMARNGGLEGFGVIHWNARADSLGWRLHPPRPETRDDKDGWLQSPELWERIPMRAHLVTLSRYQLSILPEEPQSSSDPLHFLLMAGAGGVLHSLWEVDEESRMVFLREFYKGYGEQGLSPAEALQKVQRRFIVGEFGETRRQPHYWAGFQYLGDWNPPSP
ncbi:MAG: CHAT domain-containing protein [Magnetococcales bacterium]|nr:CHAT domain-containing protein [Magnetococcales bacterium]